MSDLTDFLLARIAEDEADARLSLRNHEPGEPWGWDTVPGDGLHINRWSPARVLAECKAKREVLEHIQATSYGYNPASDAACIAGTCNPWHGGEEHNTTLLVHGIAAAMALPYADHPDYRQEWAL